MTLHIERESLLFPGAFGDSAKLTSATILVVDDNEDNLNLLEMLLNSQGYDVLTAKSGSIALDLLERSHPDVIFLDVMMPDMDGFEVPRRIRSMLNLPYIPIVLVTALQDSKSRLVGL